MVDEQGGPRRTGGGRTRRVPAVPPQPARRRPASDPRLAEIVRRLVVALHPEQVYLFGSRARGDARPDSDYDLLVIVPARDDAPERMERRAYRALRDLSPPLDVRVDLVIMTRADFEWMLGAAASLPATVRREGRLLYAA